MIPGPEVMFSSPPYDRGGMTLQALRGKIGDDAFFALLAHMVLAQQVRQRHNRRLHRDGRARGGQELDAFFDVWLFQRVKPTTW